MKNPAPWALMALFMLHAAANQPNVTTEHFDRDPGWQGKNNAPPPEVGELKPEDFRFSPTSHAGGEPGEIGGWVYRSLTPCYFARPIPTKSLDDPLKVSGKFAVTHSMGGSGALLGWFNSHSRGWRTPNSLAVRIDGEGDRFRIFFEYGTQHWKTGDGTTFEGRYQTTKTPMHPADGTVHTFSFEYNPDGAEGRGEMAYIMDGQEFRAALAEGHKADGAIFDRFGIFNQQISGNGIEVWFDDLDVNGELLSFDEAPQWEGVNNQRTFLDRALRPYHDFGYRDSNHAGGAPGEIGGIVWRIESTFPQQALAYGAPVEGLSLDQPLEASGKVAMTLASADSGVLIGWYNSHITAGIPPNNFVGAFIEGPSRIGHYFRPVFASSADIRGALNEGPVLRGDSTSHEWTIRYDPEANAGQGRIVTILDGVEAALDMPPEARKDNAAFDRFGVLSWQRGGHCVEVYFDDLAFTSGVACEDDRAPIEVGARKQLLFDRRFVARSHGMQIVANPPVKKGIVLEADRPWEDFRLTSYFTVVQDGDLCRMYYSCFDKDQWHTPRAWEDHAYLCYAESKDGIHWTKPDLGIVEFQGSRANNILLRSVVDGTVFIDPQAPPEKRYKLLHTIGPHQGGLRVSTSADGIHFEIAPEPVVAWTPDSQQNAFWDPRRGQYAAYLRGRPDMGLDIQNRVVVHLALDDIESPWTGPPQIVFQRDATDLPEVDFYTNACVYYPWAQDAYFMFPAAYHHFPPEMGNDGLLDSHMAVSRDGIRWERPDRRSYLRLGEAGAWDAAFIMMGVGLVRQGDTLYQYYNGVDLSHGGTRGMSEEERTQWRRWSKMGRVEQRLDGFYSLDAAYEGGWFETPLLRFEGDHLELNIDTSAAGLARVGILDQTGTGIPGFGLDDCDDIFINDVAHVVTWKGNQNLSSLAGKPIRLRFQMRAAKLYAFQFPKNAPNSGGAAP